MVLILPLLLALTATLANAQELSSDYVAGLIQYLNASNFVNLSLTMGVLNRQGPGSQLLAGLSDTSRDFTLFAPNDDACEFRFLASLPFSGLHSDVRL